MNLAQAWRTLPLGAADSHAEALTLAATRALRAGRPADAFEFIDRRCRLSDRPRAVDLAIRALAAHLCGWRHEAERDLSRAEAADPLDPMVAMTRLRLSGDGATAQRIARAMAAMGGGAASNLLRAVLARLLETRADRFGLVLPEVVDARLSGFAAWEAGRTVELELAGPGDRVRLPLLRDPALDFAPGGCEACYLDAALAFAPDRWRLLAVPEGAVLGEGRIWPRRSRLANEASRARAPDTVPARAGVSVIVPAYRGLDATRQCLEALLAQAGTCEDLRIVVVDDASPEPELAAFLANLAARGSIELRRNAGNLGFAGAVNRGLEGEDGRDVLFLNADAVLPQGALERLAAAVYCAPDIGTATPFSNDGEYTSLPRHAVAVPAPSTETAGRIDAAAALRGGGGVVDIPTGTGFCLFVRHDCMAAVGRMPANYGRGYFEDMEFCLRARRAGFRSVCATGLFVAHHGSTSFGAEKRTLAARNLALLRRRFPSIEAECAAYARADPLAAIREAIAQAAGLAPGEEGPAEAAAGPDAGPGPERPPSIGVVSRLPSPAVDAFVRSLSAALHHDLPQARVVVLGSCCDDLALMGRGNVFATGPLAPGESQTTARRYGVRALAAPFGARHDPAFAFDLPVLRCDPPAASGSRTHASEPSAHAIESARAIVAEFARRLAPQATR